MSSIAPPSDYLKFFLGGVFRLGHEVELNEGRLTVEQLGVGMLRFIKIPVAATEAQSEIFWKAVDFIDVWSWHPDYHNPAILDGTQWELEIRRAGRSVKCVGSNCYPTAGNAPGFDVTSETSFVQFLLALERLTGFQYNERTTKHEGQRQLTSR